MSAVAAHVLAAETMVVTGEREPRLPGARTVIKEDEIRRAQPFEIADVLKRVPGLVVRQEPGGGHRFDVGIRGLDAGRSRRVLVLEDGVPLALNPYAEPDLYFAPAVERLHSIEVLKGGFGVVHGPQTIGGVILLTTLPPPDARRIVLGVDGGEHAYARGVASAGDPIGPVRWIAHAVHRRGDGPRQQPFTSTDGMLKLAFPTSTHGDATMKLAVHDDGATSDAVGLPRSVFAADPRSPTIAPHDRLLLRRYEISLAHVQTLGDRTVLRSLGYAYTLGRVWRRQSYVRGSAAPADVERVVGDPTIPNGSIAFLRSNVILDRTYDVAAIEERLEHRITTGPIAHTLEIGGRILGEGARYAQRRGDNETSFAGETESAERHGTIALATWLRDVISVRELVVTALGVRVEHARYSRTIERALAPGGPRDVNITGSNTSTAVTPSVGLRLGAPRCFGFAGVHAGYAPPRLSSTIGPLGTPTPLEAERSVHYEIGAHASSARVARFDVSGYLLDFANQNVFEASPAATTTETSAGPTRHVGVETEGRVHVGALLKWPIAVDLTVRGAVSRATFRYGPNAGRLLPYAPGVGGSAVLDLEHPKGPALQLAWSFVGAQFTDAQNTIAEDATGKIGRLPSRHIIDIAASYRHDATGLSLRLTVRNALDDVAPISRRPEGIFTGGFRQILLGARWEYERGS